MAELDIDSGILTCDTDFIDTNDSSCHKIYLIDSLGNEFKLSDLSNKDQVCFIE